MKKPTKKQRKKLKDFKFRVLLAIHNAIVLRDKNRDNMPYEITIDKTTFTLNPGGWEIRRDSADKEIKRILSKFTVNVW